MRSISRFVVSLFLLLAFLSSTLPCGPGYITPLFDTTRAPENPYTDYAAGQLGIVKPTFHRSVLYTAFRYIAGNGMNAAEQQAIVEVWKAEIDNTGFRDDTIDAALKAWVDKRKEVVPKEEKTPDIYAERSSGSYDFFPNCTRNAFETAVETLSDRVAAHGPSDANVQNWIKAQDEVFENCATGKTTPEDTAQGAPDWLQKDRAYQKAAAEFYSLDYVSAKKHFAEIAQDSESPWAETADYLVARTLIRQASLSKSKKKAAAFYDEAETHLQRFISKSGKFTASAERLMGLIKYRNHPRERVSELAKQLTFYGGNDNFRQNVIDYMWLLDKFESEALTAEEKRKQEEEEKKRLSSLPPCVAGQPANTPCAPGNEATPTLSTNANSVSAVTANTLVGKKNDGELEINLYLNEKSYTFYVRPDAMDDEAIAEAQKVVGRPLTDEQKTQVKSLRQYAYANRFKENRSSDYEGGYYGEEKLTPSLLPGFLKQDDLTDWLFTYQMRGTEAYLYSLSKFKSTSSDLWLMTALSKADKSSTGLPRLIEAANNASRSSPAYTTIAYHEARILLELNKQADARKLITEMLERGDQLTISARNSFLALRVKLAETLEDYLTYSLRKPYGFDFGGSAGNVDELIAQRKAEYDPEYNKDGREAYEREIEENYKEEKMWQGRTMFDADTIQAFNQLFPTPKLIEVEKSPALPEYMRERFAVAIWTRAFLLDDMATLLTITPELAKYRPEFADQLERVRAVKTPAALDHAVLYFVLKNPLLGPYLEDGIGKTDNEQEQFDSNDWWCAPYDTEYSDAVKEEVPISLPPRPAFLTPAQTQSAQSERKRLKEAGDAPKFLAEKVMAWAKAYPADKRVPEALFIVIQANGWTKYGCGNDQELHDSYAKYLKKHYPDSEWTAKLIEAEKDQ